MTNLNMSLIVSVTLDLKVSLDRTQPGQKHCLEKEPSIFNKFEVFLGYIIRTDLHYFVHK